MRYACLSPSVLNTQPWWWRITDRKIELHSDDKRRLRFADPHGRSEVVNCGAALHHAQAAVRTLGYQPHVVRFLRSSDPSLLARLVVTSERRPVHGPDRERFSLADLRDRYTDRRRDTTWPIPQGRLRQLALLARHAGWQWP